MWSGGFHVQIHARLHHMVCFQIAEQVRPLGEYQQGTEILQQLGHMTATNGHVSGKRGSWQALACTGTKAKHMVPSVAGVCLGMVLSVGGLEICGCSSQYIDSAEPNSGCRGRMIYISTNSVSPMACCWIRHSKDDIKRNRFIRWCHDVVPEIVHTLHLIRSNAIMQWMS